jgi:hypothetical protein
MNSKLVFIAIAIFAAFGLSIATPVLAQNMSAGNLTGGMMTDNMTMADQNMSTYRIPKG